jgi:hypothetical protein
VDHLPLAVLLPLAVVFGVVLMAVLRVLLLVMPWCTVCNTKSPRGAPRLLFFASSLCRLPHSIHVVHCPIQREFPHDQT